MGAFVRSYKRRNLFLASLEAGDSETAAARNAGGTVREFRKWRSEDENFDKDVVDAIESGTDFIEDVATDRALKKSDTLMLAILKARRPDKFDRNSGKAGVEVNINVEGSKAKLLNRLARLRDQGKEIEEVKALEEEKRQEETKKLPAPESVGAAKAERGSRGAKRRQKIGSGRELAS